MRKPISRLTKSFLTILFACSALPAFAQHVGGGHGGGGFHGGIGSGSHPSGGGPRQELSSAPTAGSGAPRTAGPSAPRSLGGFAARAGNNYSRPGGNYTAGNQQFGNSAASPVVEEDKWHSFGGPSGSRGAVGPQSENEAPSTSGGFRVFSRIRGEESGGTVRSFSGQGREVWENSPASQNVVPKSQSLSTLHNSIVRTPSDSSKLQTNQRLSAPSRFAGGSAFVGHRGLPAGVKASNSLQPLRSSTKLGLPHGGNPGECWNCGFGFGGLGNRWEFGGGWGLGWPGFGFWAWNPFIYDPWWGWSASSNGYNNYLYGNQSADYYTPDDNSASPAPRDDSYDQANSNGDWITPNGPSPTSAQDSADLPVPVLIYMKNGAVYSVRDYWMTDDELNYILMDGARHSVDLEQVDLPRTNTENAKSGVRFIFKSEPSIAPTPPEPAPSPTEELNAVPQPEART